MNFYSLEFVWILYLAIASALIETTETFALDGRHTIPVVNKITQIDPRFTGADVSRQQVATSRFETDTARSVV